jgi:hypothetical protein
MNYWWMKDEKTPKNIFAFDMFLGGCGHEQWRELSFVRSMLFICCDNDGYIVEWWYVFARLSRPYVWCAWLTSISHGP